MKRVTRGWIVMWALVAAAGVAWGQEPPPEPPDDRPPYDEPGRQPKDPQEPPEPARQDTPDKDKKAGQLIDCTMTFNLKGWSAIYRTAQGDGTITCDNGETHRVELRVKGGGLTFGKSEVVNGTGRFTKVKDIDKLFGAYAAGEAHAGVGASANAQVLTKGNVSVSLAGTGQGVDLGLDFSRFVIRPEGETKQERKERKQKNEAEKDDTSGSR